MVTENGPAFEPQTLSLQEYSQQAHATNQLHLVSRLTDDAMRRRYLSGGLVEEWGEVEGCSDDLAYGRSEVLRTPLYTISRYRQQLRTVFPEQVALHEKEFGDVLWYLSERLHAEPTEPEQRLSLYRAANDGLAAIDPDAPAITTFAEIDRHSQEHPLLLTMPHPLYGVSLPDNVDDLFVQPVSTWPGEVFPKQVEPVYGSALLFNRHFGEVVTAIDDLDRGNIADIAATRRRLTVAAGKVLWAASFILRERLGSSLAEVAVASLLKTAGRVAKGNVFGSGDAR